jgi:crescentin
MASGWTSFRKNFGRKPDAEDRQVQPPPAHAIVSERAPTSPPVTEAAQPESLIVRMDGSLDTVGQKSELIRVRFANLIDRLDEIRSLKDDFALLSEPVYDLIRNYPNLQSRLMETEAVLKQEADTTVQLRRELADLTLVHSRLTDDLSSTLSQLRKAEAKVRDHESSVEDLRLNLKDKEAIVADLENQLAIETERARNITEENQALRLDAHEADQTVARAERDLVELREKQGLLDHEVKRLQKVAEEQNYRLSTLTNRNGELESLLESSRQNASELESKLMAEQVSRQRLETQMDAERSSHQTAISALDMKIVGLTSRQNATDKILAHTRDQLRDKNEAYRGVERSLKEATIERNTLDRRLEATQQEVERQVSLGNELQRSRLELQERVEMLNKAIAAKDFQIESSDNKIASLTERVDQITKRFEQERNTLEAANRRLTEELQNEKAERSLIQGALEIARESRVKIQKKYLALRKHTRLDPNEDDMPLQVEEETETNVRPLKTSDAE